MRRWLLLAGKSIRSLGDVLNIEWQAYGAVVIRSTWDYVNDPDAFLDVLGEIERSGTPLLMDSISSAGTFARLTCAILPSAVLLSCPRSGATGSSLTSYRT